MARQHAEVREGSVVAGYRVVGTLGVGGSGTVFRAQRVSNGAIVALKLLNAEHAQNEGERQRFAREAEVVRQLAHPHVVGLLDYGFADGLPYLVFPLLEGRTLEARIQAEGKVGWGLTGRFSEQALSALEVAHGLSIAHRDIKPANIFCCRAAAGDEVIRILDFGTAKIVGPKTAPKEEVTRYGILVGTPRYMAPEQVRGEELTPAADVYSFGLVMAEMLLGRPLVAGTSELEIFVAQGSDAPHVLPEEIRSSPFAAVIERAVAKPLNVRYRLASQMLADVRAILARYDQGVSFSTSSRDLEADLEVTKFIGTEQLLASVNESAEKLRTAFNAIAAKAPAQKAPAFPDEAALPTQIFTAVQEPSPTPPPSAPVPSAPPPSGPAPSAPVPHREVMSTPEPVSMEGVQPTALPPFSSPPPAPTASTPPPRSSSKGLTFAIAGVAATLAIGAAVFAFVHKSKTLPSDPVAASSAGAPAESSESAPIASSAVASAPPAPAPPSAPPGAFTTKPIDRATLGTFLWDTAAKQTPEIYETALQGMAGCEIPRGAAPTCVEWKDYEAVLKRPMAKGGAKKRLTVATKYLQHASPSVRILAARVHASAKEDADFDGLLAAAKVEPDPAVLGEMLASMTRSRDDLLAYKQEALAHADERVRAGACTGLAATASKMPLEPIVKAAADPSAEVRTACFAALTAAWVHTASPRKEAYEATLAILEKRPRNVSHLPEGVGKIREAMVTFPPEDLVGPQWLAKATFYDAKKTASILEDVALDASVGLPLRRSALEALGAVAGKKRVSSVRKKLTEMSDEDSKALTAKPKQ